MIQIFEVITLSGGTVSLVFSLGQLTPRDRTKNNIVLALLFLFLGIFQICNGLRYINADLILSDSAGKVIYCVCITSFQFSVPLIYFYFESMFNEAFRYTKRILLHFLPPILIWIVILGQVLHNTVIADFTYDRRGFLFADYPFNLLVSFFSVALALGYNTAVLISYMLINKKEPGVKRKNWIILFFNIFMFILLLIWACSFFFSYYFLLSVHVGTSVYIALLYIFSNRYPYLFHLRGEERQTKSYKRSTIDNLDVNSTLEKLNELLVKKEVYSQSTLRIKDVSDEIGITSYQLSELINRNTGMSFTGYINQCRVNKAKRALLESPENTVLEIAMEVGFNSQSVFDKVFKKYTGTTPTQFRKNGNKI